MSKRVLFSDTVDIIGHSGSKSNEWAAELADRLRFQRRIKETGRILEPVLLKKLQETSGVHHENKTVVVGATVLRGM